MAENTYIHTMVLQSSFKKTPIWSISSCGCSEVCLRHIHSAYMYFYTYTQSQFMHLNDYSDLQVQPVICGFGQPQCTVLSRLMLFMACRKPQGSAMVPSWGHLCNYSFFFIPRRALRFRCACVENQWEGVRGERSPQANDRTLISVVSQAKWAKACSVPSCVWAATTNTRLLSVPHSRRSHLTVTQPWRSSSWPRPSGRCWRARAAMKSRTSWGDRSAATQHRWYWSGWPETRWVPCHTNITPDSTLHHLMLVH